MSRGRRGLTLALVLLGSALVLAARSLPVLVGVAVFGGLVALSRSRGGSSAGGLSPVVTRDTWMALTVAFLAVSAHLAGSPLGLLVGLGLGGLAVLDLVVALLAVRRVTATIAVDRTEVLVGEDIVARLAVDGPPLPLAVRLGPSPLLAVDPGSEGPLTVTPTTRGVIGALPLERRSTGLCGLIGLVRQGPVVLPRPVFVGPRPLAPDRPFPDLGGRTGDGTLVPAATGDVVRGVRQYVAGDRRTLVHWRASARAGELVVKQVEEPFTPVLVVVLDMGYGGDVGAEPAAGRAAWYLTEALRRRSEVVLISWEAAGPRTAPVGSTAEVIRRLAGARGGPPLPAPSPPPGHRVLRVGLDGDTWS